MDHLSNFSFQKSYGGSFFSFFELDSTEVEEINDESPKNSSEEE
jgi:hypothetical protein